MSITDELRDYIKEQQWCAKGILTAIADRIDLEHAHGMEERADRYSELRAKMNNCYVELPKDADGEYIHVGDVMEFSRFEIERPVTREVDGVGKGVFFAWCGERGYEKLDAGSYRHHKQPTVEDVLREMADRCYADEDEPRDRDAIVAEYAAKLRLVGDE